MVPCKKKKKKKYKYRYNKNKRNKKKKLTNLVLIDKERNHNATLFIEGY